MTPVRSRLVRCGLGLGLALGALMATAAPAVAGRPITEEGDGVRQVRLAATPFSALRAADPTRSRFGALTFVGGLRISALSRFAHSLSGLWVSPDGSRLSAITDTGGAFAAGIERDAAGRPTGLADPVGTYLRDDAGMLLTAQRRSDCEGLDLFRDSKGTLRAYASFEGPARLALGTVDGNGLIGALHAIDGPAEAKRLPWNASFETVARRSDGAVLLIAEGRLPGEKLARAWLGRPEKGSRTAFPAAFSWSSFFIGDPGGYAVTDAKFLADGSLVVLERTFEPPSSFAMRIRLMKAGDMTPGATVSGTVLMTAGAGDDIDNMEGLAVFTLGGHTRIGIVSDDNDFFLEQTLYLEFELR